MMKSVGILSITCALVFGLLPIQAWAQDNNSEHPARAEQNFGGDWLTRSKMSGDWGGYRTKLVDNGVKLDVDLMQVVQGVNEGGLDPGYKYGGSADYWLHLDTDKMGLWPGGFVTIFAESQFGENVLNKTGVFTAVNSDALFPKPDEQLTNLTSVVFMQFLSEQFGIVLGKLQTLDGDLNAFASGRGNTQFFNQNFVFNPVTIRTIPYSTLGGGIIILPTKNLEEMLFTFTALDPSGVPDQAGFDDAFEDGVALASEFRFAIKPFGLPGHQSIGGTWSSKNYAVLDQEPRLLLLQFLRSQITGMGGVKLDREDDSWSVYYNFDQFFYTEASDETQGLGLFGRFGQADDRTNPIERFYSIGLGGKGLIPTRDQDTFGIGFYYIEVSDKIPSLNLNLLDDGKGGEFFYNIELTPWFHLTPNFQIIEPGRTGVDTVYLTGLRAFVDF